ncbi:MAG: RsmD family RNA methyltransferase [Candidatus Cloacimonetes bacterium]|jgi:predicted RNA methylase|nr:RsmD family RNA methyltransferase [Candidatus Cloacimonadota bacterium]
MSNQVLERKMLFPNACKFEELFSIGEENWKHSEDGFKIGSYCNLHISSDWGKREWPSSICVKPNPELIQALCENMLSIDGGIYFEIVIFGMDGQADVYAKYNQILGSRLIAELDLSSIPIQTTIDEPKAPEKDSMKPIAEDVLSVLKECEIGADSVRLPARQLDRALYCQVKKVLEDQQGKWKGGKTQAFIFTRDPREALAEVLNTGKTESIQKKLQAFFTPEDIAKDLVALAEIEKGDVVLEPSAGEGALLREILATGLAGDVNACELDRHSYEVLCNDKEFGSKVAIIQYDFLETDAQSFICHSKGNEQFDKVIMNPPFAKGQDMKHILHAWGMLKPGGRLVAICSPLVRQGTTKLHQGFLKLFKDAEWIEVEAGAFKKSGTTISTLIMVADKSFFGCG